MDHGELAINYADGKLYYKNNSNTISNAKLISNIVGTANEVTVSESSGTFTISLPDTVSVTTVNTSSDTNIGGKLSVTASSGDEGGEIFLAQAATNTSLAGGITIDSYQNKIRFFEQGGSARGAYIDLTACAGGAGTNLLSGGGGATTLDGLNDVTAPSPSSGDFLKYNGSAWVNDAIDLGTDTTGNYMSNVTAGDGITVTHTPGEGSSAEVKLTSNSVTINGTSVSLGNSATVTANAETLTGTSLKSTVTGSSLTSVGTLTAGTWTANTIGVQYGGTGLTTITANGILYGNGTGAIANTGAGTDGYVLTAGTGGIPTWTANTGTGNVVRDTSPNFITSATTSSATFDLINTNAANINFAGAATNLQIGATTGTTTVKNDLNIATGKTFEINNTVVLSSTTLGSTVVTSSLTALGNITTGTWNATTISVSRGGTGVTSFTANGILYGNGTGDLANTGAGTSGQVLTAGTGGVPTWTANTGTGSVVRATSPTISSPSVTTSITTGSTTFGLVDSTATTVNFAGAATAINMGGAGCATTITGSVEASGRVFSKLNSEIDLTAINGSLIIGSDGTAAHIAIDRNEIQSKGANGTTATTLLLNDAGGDVELAGGVLTTVRGFNSITVGAAITMAGALSGVSSLTTNATTNPWVLQNSDGTDMMLVSQNLGVYSQSLTSSRAMAVISNNLIGYSSSTIRHKEQIENYTFSIDSVLGLETVRFKYKDFVAGGGPDSDWQYGVIAEQAEEVGLTELVQYDEEGIVDYFAYERLAVAQHGIIKVLWEKVQILEEEINLLKNN